ncbi:MAG: histidine kinase dimerization/phosphoacceptor domain -containing protein [Chitinophagaceae bacterium]
MSLLIVKKYVLTISIALCCFFSANNCYCQDEKREFNIIETTKNDSIKSASLSKLSIDLCETKNEVAISYGLQAKDIAEHINNNYLKEVAYLALAICYDVKDDLKISQLYYRKAIVASKACNDLYFLGKIYNEFAINYKYRNMLDSSLFYNLKAIDVRKELKLKNELADSYNSTAIIYRKMNDFDNAIEFYHRSIKIQELTKDDEGLLITNRNIAALYKNQKKIDSAFVYYNKALAIAGKLNDLYNEYIINLNMGLCLNDLKKYHEALNIFNRINSTSYNKKDSEYPLLVLGLGEANIGIKKYSDGIGFLKEAQTLKYNGSPLEYAGIVNKLLSTAYEGTQQQNLALEHYKIYKLYYDSMYTESNTKNVNELSAKYKTKEKEQEIILLNKDNQLKDLSIKEKQQSLLLSQLKNQQNEQSISLLNKENELKDLSLKDKQQSLLLSNAKLNQEQQQVTILNKENALKDLQIREKKQTILFNTLGLIFISIIAIGSLYLYRNKKRTSNQLEEKNNIITHSLKEKEILLKEIHHRVKNNLQVISSLLNLQSKNISDEKALLALNEGRNRVKSMALIHQNLYRDDNLMGVDLKEYIEKLTEGLFASYNIQPNKITLQTNIEKLEMDVDTVIPLGLILNELISNALKYAFEGKENGLLEIDLVQQNNKLLLRVKDNGVGIPKDKNLLKSASMGYKLIQSFLQKLNATMEIKNDNGTNIELLISKYKLV